MTVSSTTTKVSYSGDGTTSAFAYSFKIFNDSDLVVIVRTDSTGAEVTKTLNTDYLVSNAGESDGGTVTFKFDTGNSGDSNYDTTDRRPQSGETVLLKRVMTLTQNTDYTPNDSFPAAAHEEALDKLTFIQQQQQEELDRTFKFAETDVDAQDLPASAERANKYLGFNSEGNAIAVDGTTNATTISTFGATLVDDADASAARTTLGLGSLSTLSTILTANITDSNITTAKLADNAVTNAKMADDSVGADELIDNSVGAAALNISGNGSSGQAIVSDADGSFSYKTLANQAFMGTTGTNVASGLSEITSVNITPTSTSSKILILASMYDASSSTAIEIELQRDSTVLTGSRRSARFGEVRGDGSTLNSFNAMSVFWLDEPDTTSQVNYKLMSELPGDNANIIAIEISS